MFLTSSLDGFCHGLFQTLQDIVGFTAWSSTREPSHCFQLLEHIYLAFDKLAYRHGVFKVEVVGDCYVAVS